MASTPHRIGIIGGSGLGEALLAAGNAQSQTLNPSTPFGTPSSPLILSDWISPEGEAIPIAFLARHGIGHTIPPSAIPFRANIWALKAAGCRWIVASGAVGSLREHIAPRDLVLVDQLIDKTHRRAGTFFDQIGGGAVHVEFADPVCPRLHAILQQAAANSPRGGATIHDRGTYVCMEGPAFSTRAESLMHQKWGGDLIGMTACPEAQLAREAQISYALIALATDYDCWKLCDPAKGKTALLQEIISNMQAATQNALALLKAVVPMVWQARDEQFAAHRALELAIWTDKSRIPEETRERLGLLWGEYF